MRFERIVHGIKQVHGQTAKTRAFVLVTYKKYFALLRHIPEK
jgi:hypothetical protein